MSKFPAVVHQACTVSVSSLLTHKLLQQHHSFATPALPQPTQAYDPMPNHPLCSQKANTTCSRKLNGSTVFRKNEAA